MKSATFRKIGYGYMNDQFGQSNSKDFAYRDDDLTVCALSRLALVNENKG